MNKLVHQYVKNTKGITIVVLVITIVILLILAGITISQLTENGLFEKAKLAKQKSYDAQNEENAIIEDYIDKIGEVLEKDGLQENIKGNTIEFWGRKISLPFKGEGTEKNPYKITSASELVFVSIFVNYGESFEGKYFELSNDINLNENKYTIDSSTGEISFSSDAKQWIPIGNAIGPFKGIFDGKNHVIKGIYISDDTLTYQGLFGKNEGIIKNISLSEGYIYGSEYISGICGVNEKNGIIEKCHSNIILLSDGYAGGICGLNKGTIQECYNESKVTTSKVYSGGICGDNRNSIKYCYNLGNIFADKNDSDNSYAGGIVGINYANVQYTYNRGKISNTGGKDYLGGIVGQSKIGNLYDSYSSILNKVIGRDYPSAGITTNAKIIKEEEMKTEAFIELIGGNDYWKIDETTGNVILKWQ